MSSHHRNLEPWGGGMRQYIKFCYLVSEDHFQADTLLNKNECTSLNNGPIFKIELVPETRKPHKNICAIQFCEFSKIRKFTK